MFFFDPRDKFFAQLFGEFPHGFNISIRNGSGAFIIGRVALLAKQIEHGHSFGVGTERLAQGIDHTVMMIHPFRLVSSCGQSGGRDLKRGVVSDVEAPVVVKTGSPSGGYITVGDGDEISDLVGRRLVRLQPSVSLPVL